MLDKRPSSVHFLFIIPVPNSIVFLIELKDPNVFLEFTYGFSVNALVSILMLPPKEL